MNQESKPSASLSHLVIFFATSAVKAAVFVKVIGGRVTEALGGSISLSENPPSANCSAVLRGTKD